MAVACCFISMAALRCEMTDMSAMMVLEIILTMVMATISSMSVKPREAR